MQPHAYQERTSKSQPYYLRGDDRFDTDEGLQARMALLEYVIVVIVDLL